MGTVKLVLLAGILGFAYCDSNLFTKPYVAWTASDMITLLAAGMLTLFIVAGALLHHRGL